MSSRQLRKNAAAVAWAAAFGCAARLASAAPAARPVAQAGAPSPAAPSPAPGAAPAPSPAPTAPATPTAASAPPAPAPPPPPGSHRAAPPGKGPLFHVVVLPTSIRSAPPDEAGGPKGGGAAPTGSTRGRAELEVRGHEVDMVLADAAQDLGMIVDVAPQGTSTEGPPPDEIELSSSASNRSAWLIAPSLGAQGADLVLRIVASPPGSSTLFVRTETVEPGRLTVRAVVMLRDLLAARPTAGSAERAAAGGPGYRPQSPGSEPSSSGFATPARSTGRATLALNGALFGGFVGYSVQRSSGSDDPRLLYPLMAIGTGLGLGASMIVADEWDVGLGDAWFVAAGAWWPALSGFFIARGDPDRPAPDRYAYALVGAGAGLGLTTLALSFGGMSEGGALLTHSAGTFGMLLGGATELYSKGSVDAPTPYKGAGYGIAAGVAIGGALATLVSVEPTRVLAIDLGAGLGGLAGAAAASPLLFGERTAARDRTFLATTMAATVLGGAAAAIFTRGGGAPSSDYGRPMLGLLGASSGRSGEVAPIVGVGWHGALP